MEGFNLGYQTWPIAIYMLTTSLKGLSSMRLHRDLGITQKLAWYLAHRIRDAWSDNNDSFVGPVKIDETYIGGRERSKHESKKLHAGRGTIGKTAVIGARDRGTNQIEAEVIPSTNSKTLLEFIHNAVEDGAKIYSDDARAYASLENQESVKHSVGEYVRGQAHTNSIESFWSLLKRGHYRTYHHMSVKHLHRERPGIFTSTRWKFLESMVGRC